MATILGIDVSQANGSVDWSKVKDHGVRFAFIKINEGDWIDPTASAARVAAIRKAGIIVGGYDFLTPRPGRSGAKEFDIHYHKAKQIGLYKKGDLRPVADVESAGRYPNNAIGRPFIKRYVKSWVTQCQKRVGGHHPIIYTGYFWRETLGNWAEDLGCHLWLAAYPTYNRSTIPKAWNHVSLHQYSEKGRVPGVPGDCDLNRYTGTLKSLRAELCLKH